MSFKLYVRNFSYSTTEDDLRNLFFQAGTITSIELIRDRYSGSSKGYAFVEMSTQSEAQKAVFMFNRCILADHELRINLVHEQAELNGIRNWGTGYPRRRSPREGHKHY